MIKATLRNPALRKRASQFGRLVRNSAVTPLCGETHKPRLVANGELGITFIGHSSFFLQMGGQNVTIDPNFARWLFVLKRLRRPGVRVRDLPAIDLVLVTHAHFDHLHRPSLRAILSRERHASHRPGWYAHCETSQDCRHQSEATPTQAPDVVRSRGSPQNKRYHRRDKPSAFPP